MAQKGIREYHTKLLLSKHLSWFSEGQVRFGGNVALVSPNSSIEQVAEQNAWVKKVKLVVKPDQLFGKRGKNGLVLTNASFDEAKSWIAKRMNKEVTLNFGGGKGELTHFLIEPYIQHDREYYISFNGEIDSDTILFSTQGGIDIEDHQDALASVSVPIKEALTAEQIQSLLTDVHSVRQEPISKVILSLFKFYRELHFAFMEINPFSLEGNVFYPLDAVGRLDTTAEFICAEDWGSIEYPTPFGIKSSPEESYIDSLDAKTGASLKLTILNRKGKIWTMVAGGGASVIYADTVADLGMGAELANYGEYSGNPSTEDTYEYAKTILKLMTDNEGKILIIGGGIANFTDIAKTFDGIILALEEYAEKIKKNDIKIYIRRGGPNYKIALERIRNAGERLGLNLEAHGPELHMTRVVKLAVEAL